MGHLHSKEGFWIRQDARIIFATAMLLTAFLVRLELTPKRYKGMEHPEIYLSEFLVLVVPPLVISCVLIAIRRFDSHDLDPVAENHSPPGPRHSDEQDRLE